MIRLNVVFALGCAAILSCKGYIAQADDAGFRKAISEIARTEAVKQLKAKKFAIKESGFDGRVEAIDPDKYLTVAIQEFNLGNDLVKVKLKTGGRFELAGSIKQGETSVEVQAEVALELSVAAQAQLSLEGNDFYVQPHVNDLNISLEIKSLTKPSNLAGGKELLAKIVNTSFKNNKAKIVEGLNKSLGKQKIVL